MGHVTKTVSNLQHERTSKQTGPSLNNRLRTAAICIEEVMCEWDIAGNKRYLLDILSHAAKEQYVQDRDGTLNHPELSGIESSRLLGAPPDSWNFTLDDQVSSCIVPVTHPSPPLADGSPRALHGEAAEQHANSSARYRQLIDSSPEAILVCSDYKLSFLNRAACRLFGVQTPSRLLGRDILQLIGAEHRREFHERFGAIVRGESGTYVTEQQWLRIDRSPFDAEISACSMEYGESVAVQLVIRDVSERKRSEAFQAGQCDILNLIAAGAPLPEILAGLSRIVEHQIDDAQCAILHLDAQGKAELHAGSAPIPPALLEQPVSIALHPTTRQNLSIADAASRLPSEAGESAPPVVLRHAASLHGLYPAALLPIINREDKTIGAIAIYHQGIKAFGPLQKRVLKACAGLACMAIESRTADEHIRYLAHYDGLTSLPNRFLFKEYLDQTLATARKRQHKFAVLFLDLDKFKEVNDRFGHDAGDEVLRQIAGRMRACLRHTDKMARMGGDEFYVLIEALNDSRYAADVARKLLDAASRPVPAAGHLHRLSASIGISIYPDDGNDTHALLQNADAAMYRAKEMGKDGFAFFSPTKLDGDCPQT